MITLKNPTPDNASRLYSLIEMDREYYFSLPWAQTCTEDSLIWFFQSKKSSNDIISVIYNNDDPIGVIDGRVNGDTIDIGYWMGKQHTNKGYMSKAVSLFVSETTYLDITAKVKVANIGSTRVLEKCGFSLTSSDSQYHHYRF